MLVPFNAMESYLGTRLNKEHDLDSIPQVPTSMKVWLNRQYTDFKGWHSIPNADDFELRPSRFADGRLRFLDPIEGTVPPEEFKSFVSGKYDVKSWMKNGTLGKMLIAIEGETLVLIKVPGVNSVVTWQSPERLPTLEKTWKPIMFLINSTTTAVRITKATVLMLTHEPENNDLVKVYSVDYNGGFCCVHPCNNVGIVSGAYCVPTLANCLQVPPLSGTSSSWGYYVQFYPWGCLLLPKSTEIFRPNSMVSCCQEKNETLALVFNHPNMLVSLNIKAPDSTRRVLEAGRNYAATAVKTSETDILVYLLLDGQLMRYNYSFDLRLNKEGKPMIFPSIAFKFKLSPEEKAKVSEMVKAFIPYEPVWQGVAHKESELLIASGCPNTDLGHLVNEQTAAIFDAETGMYLTHPPTYRITNAFQMPSTLEHKEEDSKEGTIRTTEETKPGEPTPSKPTENANATATKVPVSA